MAGLSVAEADRCRVCLHEIMYYLLVNEGTVSIPGIGSINVVPKHLIKTGEVGNMPVFCPDIELLDKIRRKPIRISKKLTNFGKPTFGKSDQKPAQKDIETISRLITTAALKLREPQQYVKRENVEESIRKLISMLILRTAIR